MIEGTAYQAASGQWSFVVQRDGEDLCRGAGYQDEDDALAAMHEVIETYA